MAGRPAHPPIPQPVNAFQIYTGSNGEATTALYKHLETLGPAGIVAVNLFRACKCSERAKVYSRRYKGDAYGRKQWSLDQLALALQKHPELGIRWGWKIDPSQTFHNWVIYVDLPRGQVSFHTASRGVGPDYPGEWDGQGLSAQRIVSHVQNLLDTHTAPAVVSGPSLCDNPLTPPSPPK